MNFIVTSLYLISIMDTLICHPVNFEQSTPLPAPSEKQNGTDLAILASFVVNSAVRFSDRINDLRREKGLNTLTKEKLVRISLERHPELLRTVNQKYINFMNSQ